MSKFVIAWRNDATIFYLAAAGDGVRATEDMAEAMNFDTYEAGWQTFQRWQAALCDCDGAVLLPEEIAAQFDDAAACPRRPFYQSDEAINALRSEMLAELEKLQVENAALVEQVGQLEHERAALREALEQAEQAKA